MLPLAACSKGGEGLPSAAVSVAGHMQATAQASLGDSYASEGQTGAHPTGESDMRASYQHCIDGAEGVTPDMQDCISEEYAYQDQRLNDAYARLLAVLDSQNEEALRNE